MAANYFQKAADLNPNLTSAQLALAGIYVRQGKLQDIGPLMEKVLQKSPDNAMAHHYMGLSLEAAQQTDKALAEFSKAVELDDSLADAHYKKGRILRMQKQVAPALVELEKAVSLQADNADYLTELGVGYYEGQQVDKALDTLAKATAMPEYENALGWAFYGVALKDKQRFAEAAGYFEKAIAAYPNFGLAHWGLAWSAFGQIAKGCPCDANDEAKVKVLVEHAGLAAQYGVNDPGLKERADILGRGEKVK
jgi:tetratricopeptide (TPR) repeat protein